MSITSLYIYEPLNEYLKYQSSFGFEADETYYNTLNRDNLKWESTLISLCDIKFHEKHNLQPPAHFKYKFYFFILFFNL